MTRKHATMTDGEGICLAFQSEHGGFDCSEASIDRISGALICHDGTLEGLGEGVADAAIYPTAEIFAGARLLALDRVAEGYADGRDAHAIDAAAKSVAESVRRNCIELGGAGASMIDFAGHPFAASQWIGKNFRTSISEVDARRLMQDLTLVDIARLDRSRPLIEGLGMQARESILAFLDSMEELRASSVDVELFDRLMTDDFNVVVTNRDVAAGETITEADLETQAVPKAYCPTDAATKVSDVAGHTSLTTQTAGTSISLSSLQASSSPAHITSAIEEGHVAIALSLDSSKSLSPLLRVGDRVNVMAVVSDGATSSAETVCANVKIIALDSALSGSPDAGYSLVTLDVTEDQAAAIVANPNVTLTAIPQTAEGASDAE